MSSYSSRVRDRGTGKGAGSGMAGRINDDDVAAVRDRADIGVVAGDYTSLRSVGGRLKGLCPVHDEKTPSFTVDAEKGFCHCFGCQFGGDVYTLLMQVEALTFPEAVERLARRVGYDLRYEELSPGRRKELGRRSRLAGAVEEAAAFYQRLLAGPDGDPARRYLDGRGIDADAREKFRVGWSPDGWDGLLRHLRTVGYEDAEAVAAGLATAGQRGTVDRFRARVMFPIVDASGTDVVGFGGRVLPGGEAGGSTAFGKPPKYVNSSETDLYRKSRVLYGLNWARAAMQRRGEALVVEGYTDVIALHLAGVEHVVAACGTALTVEHLRALERHAPRVLLALDADAAGSGAADRARVLAAKSGVREVGVVVLPDGQDPADVAAEGPEAVEAVLAGALTAVEFQVRHLLAGADLSTPESRVDAYRRTVPLLGGIADPVLRAVYARDVVAAATGVNAATVVRESDEHAGRARPTAPPDPRREPDDVGSLERLVLRAALQHPGLAPPSWAEVRGECFPSPSLRTVFDALDPDGDLHVTLSRLPDDTTRALARGLAADELTVDRHGVEELVGRLLSSVDRGTVASIRDELASIDDVGDPDRRRQLLAAAFLAERHRRSRVPGW